MESRNGKKPVSVPKGVTVTCNGNCITAKGPKGVSSMDVNPALTVIMEGEELKVLRNNEERRTYQLHGLNRTLLRNLLIGVTEGFEKKLTLVGVGYKARIELRKLTISAGFTHEVVVYLPDGIDVTVTQNVNISITGIDKSAVGNFAEKIRSIRPPEPYGGKGIRYADEVVKLSAGKSGKK